MVRSARVCAAAAWAVCGACVSPLWAVPVAPEIDPGSGAAAIGLVVCAVLLIVERRTKR